MFYIVEIVIVFIILFCYFPFIILQKYNNINWKEQLPDIPSHIGESVYPGIRLDTLAKIVPDSVPNSVSNKLPNTVPNFAPVPIISHNHVPNGIQVTKDEPVDAPRSVGIKQEGVNR